MFYTKILYIVNPMIGSYNNTISNQTKYYPHTSFIGHVTSHHLLHIEQHMFHYTDISVAIITYLNKTLFTLILTDLLAFSPFPFWTVGLLVLLSSLF